MDLPSASTQTATSTESGSETGTRIAGLWLVLARALWLTLVIPSLGLFVIANILYTTRLINPDGALRALLLHPGSSVSGYITSYSHIYFQIGSYLALTLMLTNLDSLVWIALGLVIFWRKSDDRMGLLTAFMLITWGVTISPQLYFMNVSSEVHPLLQWPITYVYMLGWGSMGFFLALFPNGRFAPRWTRWMLLVYLVYLVLWSLPSNSPLSPYQWPLLNALVKFGFLIAAICAQLYRYRYESSLIERQQTKWVVFAIVISQLVAASTLLQFYFTRSVLLPLSISLIPLAIGIAILRYRLWDIDLIINRTLVYGMLTVSIVALYVLVVAGLGALLQAQGNLGLSLLATGLIAVLFHPLRNRLQRAVNRLMYGERDDPYRVLTRLGQRLEATLAPDTVLLTIVETVAQALKLPYAAITLKEENTLTLAASFGPSREGESLVRLPLVAQHEQVGELVLAPRAPGEAFTPADQRLLEDLSRQIGVAVYAVRLTGDLKRLTVDLQRSRERLVTAREEERRRLRRDLHDGLGPQLASLTLKLETARNRLAQDPLAQTLLSDLTQRTQATVADIRRLVYALRPPALDELGLLAALRELTLQSGDQVSLHLDAPDCLPELSAAVEVAIYRITQEALTNVVRHADARHCDIRLALDEPAGWLTLAIQDDGSGLSLSRNMGVGLVSMRERAEELSGTWSIEPVESGGTRVLARLPYVRSL